MRPADRRRRSSRRAFRRAPRTTPISSRCSASIRRSGARPGNFEAGIEMALRRILADPEFVFRFEPTPAGVAPGTPYRISDTELASRLSFFLWSSDSRRRAAGAGDRGQAARAGRARAADAPDARRPEGARAGHQLRQPVALPAGSEEREPRRHGVSRLRRQPAPGVPARDRDAVREHPARGPLGARSARRRLHVRERAAGQALRHPERLRPDFRRVPVPSDARRGLLGQGSLLLVTSNANRTSPVSAASGSSRTCSAARRRCRRPTCRRSRRSRPPPAKSVRERMEQHRANPVCAAATRSWTRSGSRSRTSTPIGRWRTIDEGVADRRVRAARGRHADRRPGQRCARRCWTVRTRSSRR